MNTALAIADFLDFDPLRLTQQFNPTNLMFLENRWAMCQFILHACNNNRDINLDSNLPARISSRSYGNQLSKGTPLLESN